MVLDNKPDKHEFRHSTEDIKFQFKRLIPARVEPIISDD